MSKRAPAARAEWEPRELATAIKQLALAVGFDRAGIAPAIETDETGRLREWLARGYGGPADGPLDYLAERVDERVDPRRVFDGVETVIAVALAYADEDSAASETRDFPRVARYARGDDYHEVIGDRLRALSAGIEALVGGPVRSRAYVDTGPVLERVFAARAGLGWQGKNTLLIDTSLGSHLLLGVLLTDIALPADDPEPDHCGTCRACLDACPTDAFPQPYVLDATRCIAYTTIEDPGPIPVALREAHGSHLFGCDICQDVCPWNRASHRRVPADPLGLRARLAGRPDWLRPTLTWVLGLDAEAWRHATRHSAMRRTRRLGLIRNALVVAGNSGDPALRSVVAVHAESEDPIVAEHARWALARLGSCDGR